MPELVPGRVAPAWGRAGPVRALTTTRVGGLATGARCSFDLGHDGPDGEAAHPANRERLRATFALPGEPRWLRQEHGTAVVAAADVADGERPVADAAWSATPGVVCAVLTADCLPLVLADREGAAVAVAHCGWRGLAAGVVENAVAALPIAADRLRAWLGPAIGPRAFEVGPEVRAAFLDHDPAAASAFQRGRGDRWFGDLYALARQRLRALQVSQIDGGGHCTVAEPATFFSWRRDGPGTGRMVTLAWIEPAATAE